MRRSWRRTGCRPGSPSVDGERCGNADLPISWSPPPPMVAPRRLGGAGSAGRRRAGLGAAVAGAVAGGGGGRDLPGAGAVRPAGAAAGGAACGAAGGFALALAAALLPAIAPLPACPTAMPSAGASRQASGLAHRPLTALDDRLSAPGADDPAAAALWQAHRRRMAAQPRDAARRLAGSGAAAPRPLRLAHRARPWCCCSPRSMPGRTGRSAWCAR